MKLHAKNGELKINDREFLPVMDDYTEYELEESDISVEDYTQQYTGRFEVTPEEGTYKKVSALVKVTQYYKI